MGQETGRKPVKLSRGGGVRTLLYMTKEQNDRRNRATSKAMHLWAERNRCPQCGRKAALKFMSDETQFGRYCRWSDCDYESMHLRD